MCDNPDQDAPDEGTGENRAAEFERHAAAPRRGMAREFVTFLGHNKKWWLAPIIVVLVLFALLVILGSSGLAPLIYTLF